jgi:hypothetical protein
MVVKAPIMFSFKTCNALLPSVVMVSLIHPKAQNLVNRQSRPREHIPDRAQCAQRNFAIVLPRINILATAWRMRQLGVVVQRDCWARQFALASKHILIARLLLNQ